MIILRTAFGMLFLGVFIVASQAPSRYSKSMFPLAIAAIWIVAGLVDFFLSRRQGKLTWKTWVGYVLYLIIGFYMATCIIPV